MYYLGLDGKVESSIVFPHEREEPALFFHKAASNIAQGQYKWGANCCHLLYDILSDYLINKSEFGENSVIISPAIALTTEILDSLGAKIIPGVQPETGLVCAPDVEGRFSHCENPWRHGGHHHSYISNKIKDNLNFLSADQLTPKNIIIYRRVYGRQFNRNIHEIEKFRDALSSFVGVDFVIVDLQDFSLAGQINLFANADRIISPHGSGLVWLNFCKPGTKCLEIFSPYFKAPNQSHPRYDFWVTANHVGVDYKALFLEDAVGKSDDPYELDMVVNPGHVAQLI